MKRTHLADIRTLIYTPENGDISNVVIFLHGGGEYGVIEKLENNGLFMYAKNGAEYPFVLFAMQSGTSSYPSDLIAKAVATVQEKYPDSTIHITGLSLGGKAVYNAVSDFPDVFKTVGSLAGLCNTSIPVDASPVIRQWHGDKDTSENRYGLANYKFNANLKYYLKEHEFITMQGYGHNVWNEVYKENGMYVAWITPYLSDAVVAPPDPVGKTYNDGLAEGEIIGWNKCIESIQLMKK